MSRLIKRQTDSETRLVCLVTLSQMPSTKVPGRVFQHDIPKITLFYMLYVFDDHVVFEGQMSSQRSTRAKSAASFYYCTYLASLEWAIFKTFLKIYGSKYTHQLVLFKGFFQMCLHAPYRKIRISAEVLCSRIGTAFGNPSTFC